MVAVIGDAMPVSTAREDTLDDVDDDVDDEPFPDLSLVCPGADWLRPCANAGTAARQIAIEKTEAMLAGLTSAT
jgi:hypothetical protein